MKKSDKHVPNTQRLNDFIKRFSHTLQANNCHVESKKEKNQHKDLTEHKFKMHQR